MITFHWQCRVFCALLNNQVKHTAVNLHLSQIHARLKIKNVCRAAFCHTAGIGTLMIESIRHLTFKQTR